MVYTCAHPPALLHYIGTNFATAAPQPFPSAQQLPLTMQRRTALAKHFIEHCLLQRSQAHSSETLPALQIALHAAWQARPATAGAQSRHNASQPNPPTFRCFSRAARDGPGSATPETLLQTMLPSDSQIVRVDDWVEVKDEKQNQVYFWNKATGDTTAVGMPRPDTWTEVTAWPPFAQVSTALWFPISDFSLQHSNHVVQLITIAPFWCDSAPGWWNKQLA